MRFLVMTDEWDQGIYEASTLADLQNQIGTRVGRLEHVLLILPVDNNIIDRNSTDGGQE